MHRTLARRSALAVVLALALCCVAAGSAVGAPAGTVAQTDGEPANETVPHEDPDEYGEDGDVEGLESWLSGWMADQLAESAIELEQGEYDRASGFVDQEYYDRLEQYVEVAGETDGEGSGETFEETGERAEEMSESTGEYEELRTEYEEARDDGDEERARELARELEGLAGDVDRASDGLNAGYDALENETGADLSEAEESVETVNEEVQETQAEIREAEFEETQLSLSVEEPAEISFEDPLEATGTVLAAGGDPLEGEELAFVVGNQTIRTTADAEGGFEFTYRPTTLALSTEELEVAYRPENASAYLGTSENVSVSVSQVEATVAELSVPERTAAGESVAVSGELSVDGVPVDTAPLAVVAGNERIGGLAVDEGAFEGETTLPISVESGEVPLGVAFVDEGRAIAPLRATETTIVEETDTGLTVAAARTDDGLRVNGTLSSPAGEAVGNRTIEVAVENESVATTTTAEDGTFVEAVDPGDATGNLTIEASYDGAGTSLAPASATTRLTGAGGSSLLSDRLLVGVALAGLVVAGAVLGARRYRRGGAAPTPATDSADGEAGSEASHHETAARIALSRAASVIETDPRAAMEHCYSAVRHELAAEGGGDRSLTHWEFYRQYDGPHTDLLRETTESYERAAFGHGEVPESEVKGLLARARELCGVTRESPLEEP